MSQTAVQEPVKARGPLNGVNTPNLFATINAVKANPPLAKFQFRAKNRWVNGTHSRGTVETFYGAGTEHTHKRTFTLEADHPAVLVGEDNAALPVEIVLYGLAACIVGGIANIAANKLDWLPRGLIQPVGDRRSAIAEIVEDHRLVAGPQKRKRNMGSDIARSARQQDVHRGIFPTGSARLAVSEQGAAAPISESCLIRRPLVDVAAFRQVFERQRAVAMCRAR